MITIRTLNASGSMVAPAAHRTPRTLCTNQQADVGRKDVQSGTEQYRRQLFGC